MIVGRKTAPQRPQTERTTNPPQSTQKPPQRKLEPLQSMYGTDYLVIYREACNFHKRNNPAKWKGLVFCTTDENQPDQSYFDEAQRDMLETLERVGMSENDFAFKMFLLISDEIAAEYARMKDDFDAMNKNY